MTRRRILEAFASLAAAIALAMVGALIDWPWLVLSGAAGVALSCGEICMAAGG
jgi:hypothetical protein